MGSVATATSTALAVPGPYSPLFVRAHDVCTKYAGLSVQGLPHYSDRGALLPGWAVVREGIPPVFLDYLQQIGIGGPSNGGLIKVAAGDNLFDSMSNAQVGQVRNLLLEGRRFEAFQPTDVELRFFQERLGLRYDAYMHGPMPHEATRWNSKIELRRLVERELLAVKFPEYHIVELTNRTQIIRWVRHFLENYGGAFIKHPDSATGEGLYLILATDNWQTEVEQAILALLDFEQPPPLILVDAWEPGTGASAQIEILEDGPRFIQITLNQVHDNTIHCGNIVTSGPLPGIPEWAYRKIYDQSMAVAGAFWKKKCLGYIGLDFQVTLTLALMLEGNYRITGAAYPTSVWGQVAPRHSEGCAVSWNVMKTHRSYTHGQLLTELERERLLCDGVTGLLPAVLIPLPTGEGGGTKIMACAVAPSVPEASALVKSFGRLTGCAPG